MGKANLWCESNLSYPKFEYGPVCWNLGNAIFKTLFSVITNHPSYSTDLELFRTIFITMNSF